MQLTMNNETAPVQSAKGINFFEGMKALMTKITNVFKHKEKPKFANANALEAIQFIEWRTKYDQRRIINFVYAYALLKRDTELYNALHTSLPVKFVTWDTIERKRRLNWPLHSNKTREILLENGDWRNNKLNIQITDSSFERRLFQFFGNLNPETKTLLDGGETKTQKELRIIESEKIFFNNISKATQASYETRLLQEVVLVLNAIQVAIDEPVEIEQPALLALPAAKEVIEVVAETLPIEEVANVTETQTTEPSTLIEQSVNIRSLSKKMTIKELKAYAKAHKIHVPGRKTKHRDIYEHIKSQMS